MPRGGKRNGRPGVAYSNRSDLTPTAAPGQAYGQAGAQLAAQQAMPIAPQPTPQSSAPPVSAVPAVAPGGMGALTRPTDRPGEPMSAGAPWGPGPSEMSLPPQAPDTDMTALIRKLPFLEELASHPNASTQTRLLYRQVLLAAMKQGG